MSKSCSDKIALKQCTSLLSGLVSRLISPENAYIDTLVLSKSQHIPGACERAFGSAGRMRAHVDCHWGESYSFRPFGICSTELEFQFSRHALQQQPVKPKASSVAVVWTPFVQETLVNGVLQGWKQDDPRGASRVSRKRMLEMFRKVAATLRSDLPNPFTYLGHKDCSGTDTRQRVKASVIEKALMGWARNTADDFVVNIAKP